MKPVLPLVIALCAALVVSASVPAAAMASVRAMPVAASQEAPDRCEVDGAGSGALVEFACQKKKLAGAVLCQQLHAILPSGADALPASTPQGHLDANARHMAGAEQEGPLRPPRG